MEQCRRCERFKAIVVGKWCGGWHWFMGQQRPPSLKTTGKESLTPAETTRQRFPPFFLSF